MNQEPSVLVTYPIRRYNEKATCIPFHTFVVEAYNVL